MNPWALRIVELNIRHYRGLLQGELDPERRKMVLQLLAEAEATLAGLEASRNEAPRYSPSPDESQGCQ